MTFREPGGKPADNHRMFINGNINYAKLRNILHQKPGKIPLTGGAGYSTRPRFALCAHCRIAQEAGHQPVLQGKRFYIHKCSLLSVV